METTKEILDVAIIEEILFEINLMFPNDCDISVVAETMLSIYEGEEEAVHKAIEIWSQDVE